MMQVSDEGGIACLVMDTKIDEPTVLESGNCLSQCMRVSDEALSFLESGNCLAKMLCTVSNIGKKDVSQKPKLAWTNSKR